MATRNINSFIQHLMTEAPMTTTGTQGRGDDDGLTPGQIRDLFQNTDTGSPIGHGHRGRDSFGNPIAKPGRTVFDMLTDPLPTIPFFTPKPTPYDQSDEDGNIIPGRGPRRPARKALPRPSRRLPGGILYDHPDDPTEKGTHGG